MRLLASLLALLACAVPARAQTAAGDAYLSGQLGNGLVSGGNARGDRSMNWLAFEARGGHALDPALAGGVMDSGARIDVVYDNEGHPDNNRRDGFALQFVYVRHLDGPLTLELGAGPYTSMNTTTIRNVETDQATSGLLATVALRYALPGLGPGTHLRVAYNHVWMRDVHHSDALMLGLGRDFAHASKLAPRDAVTWFSGALGRSITNQSGGRGAFNFMGQAGYAPAGLWAASASLIVEGDDHQRVDRRGIALQGWLRQPLTADWTFAAGLGPYIAHNSRGDEGTRTLGLFNIQLEYRIAPGRSAFFAFNRAKTFLERNDRDLFQVGIMQMLGR